MMVSELIAALEKIRDEHGDLPVVTGSFDEGALADLSMPTVRQVELNARPKGGVIGQHDFAEDGPGVGRIEDCVYMDFE